MKAPSNPKVEALLSDPAIRAQFRAQIKASRQLPVDKRQPIVLRTADGEIAARLKSVPVRSPD